MDRPVIETLSTDASEASRLDDPLWYKDAVIYQLHVKAFYDSNDDGIGDFRGLTQKLEHRDLGSQRSACCPSIRRRRRTRLRRADITTFSDYGTRALTSGCSCAKRTAGLRSHRLVVTTRPTTPVVPARAARRRLVQARFLVWTDDPTKYKETRIISPTPPVELAGTSREPALLARFSATSRIDFDNPTWLRAVRTMRFWLDMGVDGFRLDAIPYLGERDGTKTKTCRDAEVIRNPRRARFSTRTSSPREANQWPETYANTSATATMPHGVSLPLMPRMYMAIAQ